MPGLYAFYQPLVNCSLAAKLNEPREPSTRLGYTPKIPHDAQMYLLRDWLRGLDHLHTAKGMMHRDINPNNLGIIESNPPRGVILDLDSVTDETHSYEHALGTLPYMAPELIDIRLWHEQATSEQRENFYENVHYDTAVDIWSLGFSLWTMIKTKAPSWSVLDPPAEREPGQKANTAYVTQGRYNTWRTMLARTRNNRDMSDHCQLTLLHLCEQMMQWDSDDRPTAADLLKQIEAYMKGYQYHTG